MNHISYEIRTRRGAPVYAYDSLDRAKQAVRDAEKRVGVPMTIYRITRTEEPLADA